MAVVLGERLNNIADEALRTWRVGAEPIRVDVRSCLIDPLNRQQTLMSGDRVHRLLRSIMQAGFSELKAHVGIVMDISGERREDVVKHNQRVVAGDRLLPEFEADSALFTVLHTNHFTMICRCFVLGSPTTPANQGLGITTPDGNLSMSMLQQSDPAFYNYIKQGHKVIRLKGELSRYPHLVEAIVSSANHDLAMGETEVQLLVAAVDLCQGDSVSSAQIVDQLRVRFPHLTYHCAPFVSFAFKFGGGPFVEDLVIFHSEHVQADKCKTEAEFWAGLLPVPAEFGWAAVAFAKDNWSDENVKSGTCRAVALTNLGKVTRQAEVLRNLHCTLADWRKARQGFLVKLPVKVQARILGRLDIISSRVVLQSATRIPHPAGADSMVTVESLAQAALCADHDLAVAFEEGSYGGDCVPPTKPDLSKMKAVEKKQKTSTEAQPSYRPQYDSEGQAANVHLDFERRGFVEGASVIACGDIHVSLGGKKFHRGGRCRGH